MKRMIFLLFISALVASGVDFKVSTKGIDFLDEGEVVLQSSKKGLWAIAQDWKNDKPCDFVYANPTKIDARSDCTIVEGEVKSNKGKWLLKDIYTRQGNVIKCVRRYTYSGEDVSKVSLQNEFFLPVQTEKILIPAVIYYGNPSGYKNGPDRVPTFSKTNSPDVLFEEHRISMPFVSAEFEKAGNLYSVALHTLPSPTNYGNIKDQWWSLGASLKDGKTSLVSTSGAVAYNNKWGRVKSLQRSSHKYPDTYLNIKNGAVIQKTFYVSASKCEREGSGFMQAVDASLDIFQPYSAVGMPKYEDIVKAKYKFSRSRYIETNDYVGYLKFPEFFRLKDIVFGWCGQAAVCGYAYQHLQRFGDPQEMRERAQKSLDFISGAKFFENGFRTAYDTKTKKWKRGEVLSQAQGLQNMLMAIKSARGQEAKPVVKSKAKNTLFDALFSSDSSEPKQKKSSLPKMQLNTQKWEAFARKACDFHADRVLKDDWSPKSTNEGFLGAPLALGYKLFGDEKLKKASLKVADYYAKRHLDMREVYWGGTLDAKGEDKEGAWAGFQAFLSAYEISNDTKYLEYAKHAAYVMLSYTVVWKIDMPASRLADNAFNSIGWTAVSPQNEHLDVYGVLYTPQLYKLGLLLNDNRFLKLSEVMFRTCGQLIDENGSQGEQIQQTNFGQHHVGLNDDVYSFRGGYVERWTVFWITAHFLNASAQLEEMGATFTKN